MLFNKLSNTSNVVRALIWFGVIVMTLGKTTFSHAASDSGIKAINQMIALSLPVADNPGNLSATLLKYDENRPLLVLLHGCTQTGEIFARNSGFIRVAKQHRFNLLLIEQSSQNNPQLCFNWFSSSDTQKGSGEHQSIVNFTLLAQKFAQASANYLVGLSAGGAMANAVFVQNTATYSGLAVAAGLPFPCAASLTEAISCMKSGPSKSVAELNAAVAGDKPLFKENTNHHIIIATGTADVIVNPKNSEQTAQQYVSASKSMSQTPKVISNQNIVIDEWSREKDSGSPGTRVQYLEYQSLGHGWPVNQVQSKNISPYFLPSQLSLTDFIIEKWFGVAS